MLHQSGEMTLIAAYSPPRSVVSQRWPRDGHCHPGIITAWRVNVVMPLPLSHSRQCDISNYTRHGRVNHWPARCTKLGSIVVCMQCAGQGKYVATCPTILYYIAWSDILHPRRQVRTQVRIHARTRARTIACMHASTSTGTIARSITRTYTHTRTTHETN